MTYQEHLKKISALRQQVADAEKALYTARLQQQRAAKAGDKFSAQQLNTATAAQLKAVEDARAALKTALKALHDEGLDLAGLTKNWDDRLPVLLFPTRLEATFKDLAGGKKQLWLRAYPDDILVHNHEPLLTDAEKTAGQAYWKALADANALPAAEVEAAKKSAWETLTGQFSAQRSLWIARETQQASAAPTKIQAWTQGARTSLLPDRFEVLFYKNGQVVHRHVGNAIPDTLPLGPDPFRGEQMFQKKDGKVLLHSDFDWLVQFDRAVELGMGFKIDLPDVVFADAAKTIEKVVVLGLLHSGNETTGQAMLEQLLESQFYSTKGFSLLPPGTPTNNNEKSDSAFGTDPISLPKGWFEGAPPVTALPPDGDGLRLTQALGIRPEWMALAPQADRRDQAEAAAFNGLLFPATLGFLLDQLLSPALPDRFVALTRQFFSSQVSGRGPLPTIRIGRQPYGILPTSASARWKTAGMPVANADETDFLNKVADVLQTLRTQWTPLTSKVSYIGNGGDPAKVLLDVLALQPGSAAFRARPGLPFDAIAQNTDLSGGTTPPFLLLKFGEASFKTALAQRATQVRNFLQSKGASKARLDQLAFLPDTDTFLLDAKNLVDPAAPASETRPLTPFDKVSGKNYLDWLYDAETVAQLEQQDFGASAKPPTALLYLMLRHALLLDLVTQARAIFEKNGSPKIDKTWFSKTYLNFEKGTLDLTAWILLHTKHADLPSGATRSLGDFLLRQNLSGERPIPNFVKPLHQLRTLPTARLERLLTEHLDLLSYRLDAWFTGLYHHRIGKLRQPDAAQPARQGIYLGAYGWLEQLRPAAARTPVAVPTALKPADGQPVFRQPDNGGLVHAPSMAQATASAVMMAGYRQYADKTAAQTLAVNLSSERIRRAHNILEGIRNGQPLEALLGYQMERSLHDAKLDAFIAPCRRQFPLPLRPVAVQTGADLPVADEQIPPQDVADGLKIARASNAEFLKKLGIPPSALPTSQPSANLLAAKDALADTLDALSDLMVAESVFQMTRGGAERSGDVLNALENAASPPAELEFVQARRSPRFTFTNQLSLHFPDQGGNHAWKIVANGAPTQRSLLEPGLNHWAANLLGSPDKILCRMVTLNAAGEESNSQLLPLAELAIQALDFVYLANTSAGPGSELECRLAEAYRRINNWPPDQLVKIYYADAGTQAGARSLAQVLPLAVALRDLLKDARPLHANDFDPASSSLPSNGNTQRWQVSELDTRARAAVERFRARLKEFKTKNMLQSAFENWLKSGGDDDLLRSSATPDWAFFHKFRVDMAGFGLSAAYPVDKSTATDADQLNRLHEAAAVWKEALERLQRADAALNQQTFAALTDEQKVAQLTTAIQAIFGENCLLLPRFTYRNGADIQKSDSDRAQLLKHMATRSGMADGLVTEEWVQGVAAVRRKVALWERVRTLAETLTAVELPLKPVQLPYRPKDSWMAVEFPAVDETTGAPWAIRANTYSCIACGDTAFLKTGDTDLQCGILLDSWTEAIPTAEETTGLAFHYDQPDAAAPQVLLLATSPTLTGQWSLDNLEAIVHDTLEMAKMRAVEPAQLEEQPLLGALLPALLASFDVHQLNPSLDFSIASSEFLSAVKQKNLKLYSKFV